MCETDGLSGDALLNGFSPEDTFVLQEAQSCPHNVSTHSLFFTSWLYHVEHVALLFDQYLGLRASMTVQARFLL